MVGTAVIVRTESYNIADAVLPTLTEWNNMMRLEVDSSIGHLKTGLPTIFALAIGALECSSSHGRIAHESKTA